MDKVPVPQKEMKLVDAKMKKTAAAIDKEKKSHIILARATHRDDKHKIISMEKELAQLPRIEQELANSEVYTLKQLLVGKNRLVMKKSQELENATERVEDKDDPEGGRSGRKVARGTVAKDNFTNNVGGVKALRMDSR